MEKLANSGGCRPEYKSDRCSIKMSRTGLFQSLRMSLIIVLLAGALSGCGLSTINRMQNSMEQMTYYMGVVASSMPQMAFSTKRMADTAEGLQRKSEGMMNDFQKKGVSTERAVQNYAQTFIDNDRAIIKNLQGIKEELSNLKQPPAQARSSEPPQKNQERINSAILERLGRLESQLQAISNRTNKTSP